MRYAQAGRPPKWSPGIPGATRDYLRQCEAQGTRPTMSGLAAELQVSRPTLYCWLKRKPELVEAVRDLPLIQSLH